MVKKIIMQTYLWVLLLMLYAPIAIIVIYSFTDAKVLGNWTGFSLDLYKSLLNTGAHHSLMNAFVNTVLIALIVATASTLLGSIAAIGIYNLKARSRKAVGFVNSIPILNGDIITGISLFLLSCRWALRRIYDRRARPHHLLHALCGAECPAPSEADEPESV